MKEIRTAIIPKKPIFIGKNQSLDYEAICVYVAIGFFLDQDTFYKNTKALKPAHDYTLEENEIILEEKYFTWHYSPVDRPLKQIVKEFAILFESIIDEQVGNKKVILPLSGGLDSRTQAAALHHLKKDVKAYSYAFKNGHNEAYYSEKIAKACNFNFQKFEVPEGYLWNCIDNLANINGCYSEFTHPRQMAFVKHYAQMGDVFSLGHWGDVLFDDMGVPDNLSFEEQVDTVIKKITKKGGLELASSLWVSWKLEGDFKTYLRKRISKLLKDINIPQSANAQIRAFKSLYWAPRWTSTNLSIFESIKPITLPYFDNRMCEFICSIPEKYLAGRQIQIEYLKMRMPALAEIEWQEHRPFNLYNYKWDKIPFNLPYRIFNKFKNKFSRQKLIQRNWELQFLGKNNDEQLREILLENESFKSFVPPDIAAEFYNNFIQKDSVYFSHPVSMLLTLSCFSSLKNEQEN